MKKWKYKVISVKTREREDAEVVLNELGEMGWELVWVTDYGIATFKKEANA